MKTLYLKDASYIDWRDLSIRVGHLAVTAGAGGGTSPVSDIPDGADTLDCAGRIVTKSFAVGHHHAYSALARGMPPPRRTPGNFLESLELVWWHLDKKLDETMVRASARATAVEALRSGCTFVIDHHASPHAARGSLHWIAAAFAEVGLSHLLCFELSDRDGADCLRAGLEETDNYLKTHQGLVGLHASFTVSDALLRRAVDLARQHGTGVHVHVAEDPCDQADAQRQHGQSVVARLADAGALALRGSLLAHCLHIDDEERALIRDSEAWVVQNSESNRHNAVGTFDPRDLGDRIFLGTDGMHSDMLASCRAAYLDGQGIGGLSPTDAYRRLRRVHDYLGSHCIAGDADNNLVILDYPHATPITPENFPSHLVYGLRSAHVHTVLSDGRVVVDAGRLTTVDEDRVLAQAREQAARLWRALG